MGGYEYSLSTLQKGPINDKNAPAKLL